MEGQAALGNLRSASSAKTFAWHQGVPLCWFCLFSGLKAFDPRVGKALGAVLNWSLQSLHVFKTFAAPLVLFLVDRSKQKAGAGGWGPAQLQGLGVGPECPLGPRQRPRGAWPELAGLV